MHNIKAANIVILVNLLKIDIKETKIDISLFLNKRERFNYLIIKKHFNIETKKTI